MNIEPDAFIGESQTRHKPDHQELLEKLVTDMRMQGWQGRPLLVIEKEGTHTAITGTHRAEAAMQLRIPIPAVFVREGSLTNEELDKVLNGTIDYPLLAAFFENAGLDKASELMRQEMNLGGTGKTVLPNAKGPTGRGPIKIKRSDA